MTLRIALGFLFMQSLAISSFANKEATADSLRSRLPDNPAIVTLQSQVALAGRSRGHAFTLLHQGRWLNQPDNPKEYYFSYDVGLGKAKSFLLGAEYSSQTYYRQNQQSANLIAGMKLTLSPFSSLRFAAGISYNHKSNNRRGSTYSDMIDSRYGYVYSTMEVLYKTYENYISLKAGIWYDYRKLFTGLTFLNIGQIYTGTQEAPPGYELEQQPLGIHFIAGYLLFASAAVKLTPVFTIDKVKSIKSDISPALYLEYQQRILAGICYAHLNSLGFTAGYIFKSRYSLTGQLEFPVKNDLQQISKVSHALIGIKIKL